MVGCFVINLWQSMLHIFTRSMKYIALIILVFLCPLSLAQAAALLKKAPTLVLADQMDYDHVNRIVEATGHVEIAQGERVLMSDKIIYDQDKNQVYANGNVTLLEPDGNVFFADTLELSNEFKDGVIHQFRARFADNSLLAATRAMRTNETRIKLKDAVYSPCPVCRAKPKPLWQIRAKKVDLNQDKQRVLYRHATFEVKEVPIFYTPYLSHATPEAKKKSGFLVPTFKNNSLLGNMLEIPYFVNIASNMDATVTPILTGKETAVMSGQFRHLTKKGLYELKGSITSPKRRDALGNIATGHELRGHIEGQGRFNLADDWYWGFDGKRATDDTYLRRYQFGNEDTLTSKAYLEHFQNRNFTLVEGLTFQGLSREDNPSTTPFILPLVRTHREGKAWLKGSRWTVDGNNLVLFRKEGNQYKRISLKSGLHVPRITSSGQKLELSANLLTDLYFVNHDEVSRPSGTSIEHRLIPELALDWSYPFIRPGSRYNIFVEPTIMAIASPNGGNPTDIPNEDSHIIELSDTNLFSINHFAGADRVETGTRFNYGLRSGIHGHQGQHLDMIIGQNYRVETSAVLDQYSGLDDHFSDVVGRIRFQTDQIFDLSYRFNIDHEGFGLLRNEVNFGLDFDRFSINNEYLYVDRKAARVTGKVQEELSSNAAFKLTDQWTVTANGRRDLREDNFISTGASVVYEGDCVSFVTAWSREFTRDRDIEPSSSITFQIFLKNLN